MAASADPPLGLRARKKAKTRAAIQQHALRLFGEHGYEATTAAQIAEAAEVSESTFFRYFPTKAEVVLGDDFDPLVVQAFINQPPELSAIEALRGAFRAAFAQLSSQQLDEQRERVRLILSVPELRAAMLDQFAHALSLLADVVAQRTGRRADDVAVRTLTGAVVGAAMALMPALADDPAADIATLLDQAIGLLQEGLPI